MFKFNDLSDKEEDFNAQDHLLSPKKFFEKRRIAKKVYVFDLRSSEDFETSHLPGAHNLPFENFEDSIYQMPFEGEIMLYGGNEKEMFSAAEMLYDNGFETFYFIDSYDSLIGGVDASFIKISDDAKKRIIANKQSIQIIIETKTDRKANYSISFVAFPMAALTHDKNLIAIDLEKFQVLVTKEAIPYLEGTEVDLN